VGVSVGVGVGGTGEGVRVGMESGVGVEVGSAVGAPQPIKKDTTSKTPIPWSGSLWRIIQFPFPLQ
jgi:hypothetical protein